LSWNLILIFIKTWVLPLVDILAVAFIIYKTYMILYGTRAILVLNGIILIGFTYLIARFLHLTTLSLIINLFVTYGIIVFIIVFQPEIRQALMRMGDNKLIPLYSKTNLIIINEIIDAVMFMSKKKIGALIVIRRKAGLKNVETTGIKLDAVLSHELLINIFAKNTPLHDGAVIVENNRITYASCFLPLTDRRISKEYGTRHRAALGLSEESDAVVIVVSEETGRISVAVNSKLKSNFDEIQLKNELTTLLSDYDADKKNNK
jgi:diadenylate cyclase